LVSSPRWRAYGITSLSVPLSCELDCDQKLWLSILKFHLKKCYGPYWNVGSRTALKGPTRAIEIKINFWCIICYKSQSAIKIILSGTDKLDKACIFCCYNSIYRLKILNFKTCTYLNFNNIPTESEYLSYLWIWETRCLAE